MLRARNHQDSRMYAPRTIDSNPAWQDADGIKLYTISAFRRPVDRRLFEPRLRAVKRSRPVDWANTPAFAIFHEGAHWLYLILAWWSNDNELFTSVSVCTDSGWAEDPSRYSFCVHDMEVFWAERAFFIEHIYRLEPDIHGYRAALFRQE